MLSKISQKNNKVIKYLLITMVIIQPVLDTYYLYSQDIISIFNFSPSTIIRMALAFLIYLCFYFSKTVKTSSKKLLLIYSLVVIIYFIFHNLSCSAFTSLIPGNFSYSIIEELFYIIRIFVPVIIIFATYNSNISQKEFTIVMIAVITYVSLSIVITNITVTSLGSFTNETIKDNIFGWFTGTYAKNSYLALSSKAFFYFSASVASVMVMILPLVIYKFFVCETRYKYYLAILLIITLVSMLMLGSRVTTYGSILISSIMFVIYLFFCLVKKEQKINAKKTILFVVILMLIAISIPKSPALNRSRISNNTSKAYKYTDDILNDEKFKISEDEEDKDTIEINEIYKKVGYYNLTKKQKVEFIKANYSTFLINDYFINNSYTYKYDPDFWFGVIKLPVYDRINNRVIEQAMLERAKEANNNKVLDSIFGIGYSRTSHIYNLERDFVYQYYSIGILGILIFISIFVYVFLYSLIKCFRKYNALFTFKNITLSACIFLPLLSSFYSGNSIDSMFVSITLAFVCGMTLKSVKGKDQKVLYDEDNNINANL